MPDILGVGNSIVEQLLISWLLRETPTVLMEDVTME
jgi:hypothetical protein